MHFAKHFQDIQVFSEGITHFKEHQSSIEHSLMHTVLENPRVVNGILGVYSSFCSSPSLKVSFRFLLWALN